MSSAKADAKAGATSAEPLADGEKGEKCRAKSAGPLPDGEKGEKGETGSKRSDAVGAGKSEVGSGVDACVDAKIKCGDGVWVLITSTLVPDPSKPLSYTSIRSVYSPAQRLEQTVESVRSVLKRLPEAQVLVCDNSRVLPLSYAHALEAAGAEVIHAHAEDADSAFKALGEAQNTIAGLSHLMSQIRAGSRPRPALMLKLSGRYYLTDSFQLSRFFSDTPAAQGGVLQKESAASLPCAAASSQESVGVPSGSTKTADADTKVKTGAKLPKMTFWRDPNHTMVRTVLYAVPGPLLETWERCVRAISEGRLGDGYEQQMYRQVGPYARYVEIMGAAGRVSVDGTLFSE